MLLIVILTILILIVILIVTYPKRIVGEVQLTKLTFMTKSCAVDWLKRGHASESATQVVTFLSVTKIVSEAQSRRDHIPLGIF